MPALTSKTVAALRNFLMECDEVSSNSHLRSVFSTKELSPFLSSLPEADSVNARIDFLISYGLKRQLTTGQTLLLLFLEVLETRIPEIDQRHEILVNLIGIVADELSPDDKKLMGRPVASAIQTQLNETQAANTADKSPTGTFDHGYALVVGVGADLEVTVDDAKAIYEILTDKNRCGYKNENVRLLTEEKATRGNILAGLDWLATQTSKNKDATIVFYFSGHGGMMPSYHLVPYGYNSNNLAGTAISGVEFTQKLKAISSKKQLILLDCCHAGGMAEVKGVGFAKSPVPPEMNEILAAGSGRVLIASSRRDEVSYTGTPYSVYTQALRESLAGYGAAEQDGYAYVADMALYIGRWVPNRTSDKQHPILKIAAADNFAVAYYAGGDKSPKTIDEAKPIEPTKTSGIDIEMLEGYQKILRKHRENLLVVEEQMALFYDQAAIPPDLRRTKEGIQTKISELETIVQQLRSAK